jgi:predicted Zn-ribbon and HTH transcriptional regulator
MKKNHVLVNRPIKCFNCGFASQLDNQEDCQICNNLFFVQKEN